MKCEGYIMDKNYAELLENDLLEYGMVSDVFPKYFNSNGLSRIKFRKMAETKCATSPMGINLLKPDGNNRVISLPNPISYQQCVRIIFEDTNCFKMVLDKIKNNPYSHSKIIAEDMLFNIPIKENASKFMDSLRDKMYLSIGSKYCLKYDIEKFYDNVYTHYLPAGLVGFSESIAMYKQEKNASNEYTYMCNIDKAIRNLSNKETKGILTGPFVSRIFSELLLSELDDEIRKELKNENFRRYIDDSVMYVNTLDEAERNITLLKKVFQKYKLSLKMEKTQIKKIPFFDFDSLKSVINIRKNKNIDKKGWYLASQDDFFEAIYKAEKMYKRGNKGALKYVLKVLKNQKNEYGINKDFMEKSNSFLYFLNYLIVYPQYANEILSIVDKQIEYIKESKEILNTFLKNSILDNQELVSLYIIQILVKWNLEVEDDIIIDYIEKGECNEILRATFLEYVCIHNAEQKYDTIINAYKKRITGTNGIDFSQDDWLNKYVLFYHDYIDESEIVTQSNLVHNFKAYKQNNIKFINFDLIK